MDPRKADQLVRGTLVGLRDTIQRATSLTIPPLIVEHYRENGPSMFAQLDVLPPSSSLFQLDGFYTLLLGQKVPHDRPHTPSPAEQAKFADHRIRNAIAAKSGLTIPEALAFIRNPHWTWTPGFFGK